MKIPEVGYHPEHSPQRLGGKPLAALDQIDLSVMFGEGPSTRTESIMFNVVDIPYQYNIILGRVTVNAFGAVAHYNYLCMKLSDLRGVITVWGDQDLARHTELEAMAQVRHVHAVEQNLMKSTKPAATKWVPKAKPEGNLRKIPFSERALTKTITISVELTLEAEAAVVGMLRKNEDIFVWGPHDIPGVARAMLEHKLTVISNVKPKKQSYDACPQTDKKLQKLRSCSYSKLGSYGKSITLNGSLTPCSCERRTTNGSCV